MSRDIISGKTFSEKIFTVSNLLTISRILIVPIVVFGIFYKSWQLVFTLLIFGGLTDVLDGYLARKWGQDSVLGAFLDPIADKIFIVSCFAALSSLNSPSFFIPAWFVLIVVIREATIVGGAILLVILGVRFEVSPSVAGKLSTFFQLSFILWIFLCYFFRWNPVRTYSVLLIFLSIFSLISLFQYGKRGIFYILGK